MTEIQSETPILGKSIIKRVEAVDVFKFIVLISMIQGHLFRAYLLEPIRRTNLFQIHEIFHGIVAPGFLFSAGFAVFLSYFNKQEQYVQFGKAFLVRIKRTLFVIWCGYFLHLPFFSLYKTFKNISQGFVVEALKIDILQCIGVSVLIFTLIAVILKKEKYIIPAAGIAMLLFFILPPIMSKVKIWYFIDPYFDYNISLFPLFPWSGFLFLGVMAAYLYSVMNPKHFFRLIGIVGLLIFPWYFFHENLFFTKAELTLTGILTKIGGVFMLLWLANFIASRYKGKFVKLMKKAGKESLFVYIIHLFIIFNFLSFRGLEVVFMNRLNVLEATGVFLIVQALVFASSLAYCHIKEKKQKLWRILFWVFWGGFLIIFIVRPY